MINPTRFDNPVLVDAYARAVARCAMLPDAERTTRLSEAASALRGLDTNLPAELLQPQANVVVASTCTGLEQQTVPDASKDKVLADGIIVAPGVALDPKSGLPMVGGKPATNWSEAATALYGCARAIDDNVEGNRFANVPIGARKAMLKSLTSVVDGKMFADDKLEGDQAAQLRASTATVIQHLMASALKVDSAEGRQLLAGALTLGARMARAETHPGVRDSMAFGLYRYQTQLPEELRVTTRELMQDLGQLTPPYDAWAEDGVIKMDVVVDGDWITTDGLMAEFSTAQGFTKVEVDGKTVLRREVEWKDGRKVTIEAVPRTNSGSMFKNVDKDDVDIVFYVGHSGYGTNIPRSMPRAAEASGKNKLLMFGTCFGKDNQEHVRQLYPEAHIFSTFEPAYHWDVWRGSKALWDGIEGRKSWAAISKTIGDTRNGNWVTPAEVMLRRRILDSDGDGRADILDRVFDFNLQKPESATAFEARAPGQPPHRLQMIHGVTTANWLNRGVGGYNTPVRAINKMARVSCGGFFAGGADQSPVKFENTTFDDGTQGWVMTVNDHFAHMSEEALRTVAAYEFNMYLAANDERYDLHGETLDAKINGLMAVAFTLSHDLWYSDSSVWKEFKAAYGLPADLDKYQIKDFAARNGAEYRDAEAGSKENARLYLTHIKENDRELYDALAAETAGVYRAQTE